ncbi:MAG: multicopper oxidase domain-containing protein, partial [Xanthobacteraceae bacterium]
GAENGFIHLHGHSFRLLDALDDGWKPFWLDTMPVAPGGKARIAFVADDPGKWLIEGWVAPTPGSK